MAVTATQPNAPVGEFCEPCKARFRVEACYDDPWNTPITLAPLRVQLKDGPVICDGARTQALSSFGMQDGQPIQSVRPELGTHEDQAPEPGTLDAALVPENTGDPVALERQIIADLTAFARTMETAMQPWIAQWEADGWLGLFGSMWTRFKAGAAAGGEGEGDFWASVGEWISNLPDMIGDAWDSLSESAKTLWENRDKIVGLLKNLADGAVASFEAGLEAVAELLQNIPGYEELAGILKDLVEQSAEWAGAMIEVATRTRVLTVLGATMLGTMMMIPPNFWTDMVAMGVGYLIPELIIAIVLAIIAFFTAGTGGTLLAARIATYTAKITAALSKAGRAGRALQRVFGLLMTISGKVIDLIKALKGRIDDAAEGVTNGITRIIRPASRKVLRNKDEFLAKYGSRYGSDKEADAAWRSYQQTANSPNELVMGRLEDTEAGEALGMTRLNEPDWTVNVNDAWIQGGIDSGKPFYLGSPINMGNLRSGNPTYPTTVFFRELKQLRDAGYRRVGDYMVPPGM
jgi:hypothetical protein